MSPIRGLPVFAVSSVNSCPHRHNSIYGSPPGTFLLSLTSLLRAGAYHACIGGHIPLPFATAGDPSCDKSDLETPWLLCYSFAILQVEGIYKLYSSGCQGVGMRTSEALGLCAGLRAYVTALCNQCSLFPRKLSAQTKLREQLLARGTF